ncbi:MAG: Holliday junction resolvase RuvX [Bacteroidia bacterium]|nr:Holliday junction resolvase RuvX [Bacteroidia bacterium]MCX7651941.1 Holliday junction resolvase RuvX [Bacteroidia bacterium]MDW8416092.1 Holliday junction resolvase RuvX [Bacteroidia bacterium]
MGRILAIDYGLRRSGLAWTDPAQRIALPLAGIETTSIWTHLDALIPEVEKVLIGYPKRLDGRPTDMTVPVERFYEEMKRRHPQLSIELVEERLSTQAAHHYLKQLPQRIRRDKATADKLTATILLETYLLRQKV